LHARLLPLMREAVISNRRTHAATGP